MTAGVVGLALATISPSLALPLGLGLYVVLKDAKGYALFGATMSYVGMTLALVHEALRIVLFWRMPGLYQRAPEAARPAVLAMGDLVVHLQDLLGWIMLVLGVGVGLIAFPAQYFRVPGASLVVLPAMLVFFSGSSPPGWRCSAGARRQASLLRAPARSELRRRWLRRRRADPAPR